jgi:hypothetical protein
MTPPVRGQLQFTEEDPIPETALPGGDFSKSLSLKHHRHLIDFRHCKQDHLSDGKTSINRSEQVRSDSRERTDRLAVRQGTGQKTSQPGQDHDLRVAGGMNGGVRGADAPGWPWNRDINRRKSCSWVTAGYRDELVTKPTT